MRPLNRQKTFLHVGCGVSRQENLKGEFHKSYWREIRYDIDESVKPDIVGSMLNMEAIENDFVDAIYSSHNIEHLYPHEVQTALGEFLRVLKPTGYLVITCPDLQSVCRLIADDKLSETAYISSAGPIAAIDMVYGYRPSLKEGNTFMAHKCGFTKSFLIQNLIEIGFENVACQRREAPFFDLHAIATKFSINESEILKLCQAHFPFQVKS